MAKIVKQSSDPKYKELNEYLENLVAAPHTFHRGQILKGVVVSSGASEMIVDVGGRTEGVIAGRELKLEGKLLDKKAGDDILVYVVKAENDKGQIELSIRRTGTARRWHDLEDSKKNETPVEVTVIEANTGGVIVQIGSSGMRGFIPSSHLKNSRIYPTGGYTSKEDATKQLQGKLAELIGNKLEVVVMEIDKDKNRVILSEKYVDSEADMALRKETLSNLQPGNILAGEVTGIAPFGLFVTANGVEGLVHLSEISWDKVSNPADFYKIGEKVKVQVIGIDDNGKRIAYSIKRLLPDPWDEIVKKYAVGQVIKGQITKIVDYGAFVRIEEGLNGLIHISELSDQLVKDPAEVVSEGQDVEVVVISMSKEERHLGLSIKRLNEKEKKIAKKASKKESTVADTSATMSRLEEIIGESEEKE